MSGETSLPIEWNLTGEDAIVQGSSWSRGRIQRYLDGSGNLVMRNTSGYTAYMNIRADYDEPVLLSLTTENGRLQVGGSDYTVLLSLTESSTISLPDFGLGVFDIFLVNEYGIAEMNYFGRVAMQKRVSP